MKRLLLLLLLLLVVAGCYSGCASAFVGNSPEEIKHREHPVDN